MAGKKKQKYATIRSPLIEAVTKVLFRFNDEEQASRKLEEIRNTHIVSKEQDEQDSSAVKLWVKGFSVSEDEQESGFLGNYAIIRSKKVAGGKFTLYPEKVTTELKYHPQRKRPKQTHPDWGNPILRNIKKGTIFKDVEEARAQLHKLHESYPEISIPLTNKLYLIIYSKADKPPAQKYVLEIKVLEKGGFKIEYQKNSHENSKKKPEVKKKDENNGSDKSAENKSGYFTSMVELKRKPPGTK